MVRFSASPKNEPRLLPFARAKRAQKSISIGFKIKIHLWLCHTNN
ncbi:MAG: hypothetical protein U5L45_12745 [Saprospiraceae bacterium]|nr:hypothetical protein [Saprospiraceae bacterium]